MKKIIIFLASLVIAASVLMASPVKTRVAADCIKNYVETYGRYNAGKNRIKNARVGCKNGSPTVTYWNSVKRQKDGVWAWIGSFGVKKACPVNNA